MGRCKPPFCIFSNFKGLRGIGSFFIVTGHCIRAFLRHYLSPADTYGAEPHLFQRPFFRLVASGPFWVSIFCLLSGYVCAIKALRLSNEGKADEARKVIASTAFRRYLRIGTSSSRKCLMIGIPAILETAMTCVLAQLGAWSIFKDVEYWGDWISFTAPPRLPGIWLPFKNFLKQSVINLASQLMIVRYVHKSL